MGILKALKAKVNEKVDEVKAELKAVNNKSSKPAFDPLKQDLSKSFENAGLREVSQAEVRAEAAKNGLLPGMVPDGIPVEIHNHNDLSLYIDGVKAVFEVSSQSLSGKYEIGTRFHLNKNGRPGRLLYTVTEDSRGQVVYLK